MLRKLFIVPLFFAYLVITCRVALPLVNYWVNHDSYAERCENKDKPELECDGSCQVEKEVAEAAHDDNMTKNQTTPNSQRTQTTETIEFFHIGTDVLALTVPVTEQTVFRRFFSPSLLSGVGTVPFQPPRA